MSETSGQGTAVVKHFPKGAYLFKEGETTTEVYVLTSGGVEISVGGKSVTVIVDKGSFIGEMSVLLGKQRTATVVTIADSEFMVIQGAKIATLLQTMPNMGLKLLKDLAQRVEQTTQKLVNRERQLTEMSEQPASARPTFDEYVKKFPISELAEFMAEIYKEKIFLRRPSSFDQAGRDYNRFKNDLEILQENRHCQVNDLMNLARQAEIKGALNDKLFKRYENDMKLFK